MSTKPLVSPHACQTLLKALVDAYGTHNMVLVPRVCYDAFQIVISHGDEARAMVFAETGYKVRLICEGEDSPAVRKAKYLMQNPSSHYRFALSSQQWKSSKDAQPKNLSTDEFEKWLWRNSG
ncbi:hypothetical protein F5Y01DRAFT_320728 [Xylaria sp. FL0043]|nr:hypothetical protein F5Y01DRAFT_320728 [Xylaria sp. FL0043]